MESLLTQHGASSFINAQLKFFVFLLERIFNKNVKLKIKRKHLHQLFFFEKMILVKAVPKSQKSDFLGRIREQLMYSKGGYHKLVWILKRIQRRKQRKIEQIVSALERKATTFGHWKNLYEIACRLSRASLWGFHKKTFEELKDRCITKICELAYGICFNCHRETTRH